MINRRDFLRRSVVGTLAMSPLLRALAADDVYRSNIGIQLYTLRNELAKDTPGTIRSVVEAGYAQGEMFGFPNCDPLIAAAKEHGLALNSSHFDQNTVVHPKDRKYSEFRRAVEKAHGLGLTHLVIPFLGDEDRKSLDDYRKVADHANNAAALTKEAGIQLAYHNHHFEFKPHEGGKTGYDVFRERFSPAMQFEVDVFWVKVGGVDPATLIRELSGRVSQVHLKDLKAGIEVPTFEWLPNDAFKELGNGVIPMEPIIEAARVAGVKHCHVEQDQSPDPIASIRQSIRYLRRSA